MQEVHSILSESQNRDSGGEGERVTLARFLISLLISAWCRTSEQQTVGVRAGVKKAKTNHLTLCPRQGQCFQPGRSLWKIAAGGPRFSSRPWQLCTVSVKLWVRGRSGGKAERGRGTKPAIIFGVKQCTEIFHRSDGAGNACLLRFSGVERNGSESHQCAAGGRKRWCSAVEWNAAETLESGQISSKAVSVFSPKP